MGGGHQEKKKRKGGKDRADERMLSVVREGRKEGGLRQEKERKRRR